MHLDKPQDNGLYRRVRRVRLADCLAERCHDRYALMRRKVGAVKGPALVRHFRHLGRLDTKQTRKQGDKEDGQKSRRRLNQGILTDWGTGRPQGRYVMRPQRQSTAGPNPPVHAVHAVIQATACVCVCVPTCACPFCVSCCAHVCIPSKPQEHIALCSRRRG